MLQAGVVQDDDARHAPRDGMDVAVERGVVAEIEEGRVRPDQGRGRKRVRLEPAQLDPGEVEPHRTLLRGPDAHLGVLLQRLQHRGGVVADIGRQRRQRREDVDRETSGHASRVSTTCGQPMPSAS